MSCSEKKLRRLEVASQSPKLARLQLYRLLSHSEARWQNELAAAGMSADGVPTSEWPAQPGAAGAAEQCSEVRSA